MLYFDVLSFYNHHPDHLRNNIPKYINNDGIVEDKRNNMVPIDVGELKNEANGLKAK